MRAQGAAREAAALVAQAARDVAAAAGRWRLPERRVLWQGAQLAASLAFVVLYVWSTYSAPAPFSLRYNLDLALCAMFGADYLWRLKVRRDGRRRAMTTSAAAPCAVFARVRVDATVFRRGV